MERRQHFTFNEATPVFPTVGNHEAFPVNMLPLKNETGKYNPSWLYNNLADFYLTWLPGKAEQRTLREGGFYTVSLLLLLLPPAHIFYDTLFIQTLLRPGLRLVSINSNVCNNLNFWLLLDFNDPAEHLHWIYRTLHKAELNKEDVYIIGHIPPGRNSCYSQLELDLIKGWQRGLGTNYAWPFQTNGRTSTTEL